MKSRYQSGGAIGASGGKSTVGILLYSYCARERSSCAIEQGLCDHVALRGVAANQSLAHATSARFRRRHLDAIAGGFSQVVALSVSEGLVQSGVVAIDGTKIEADVSAE
jgi:transposase